MSFKHNVRTKASELTKA